MSGRRSFKAMCSIFSFVLLCCPFALFLFVCLRVCFLVLCSCASLPYSLWYATEFYSRWFTPSLAVCSLCPYRSCLLTPKLLCRFLFLSSPKKIAPREWFFYFIIIYTRVHMGHNNQLDTILFKLHPGVDIK